MVDCKEARETIWKDGSVPYLDYNLLKETALYTLKVKPYFKVSFIVYK